MADREHLVYQAKLAEQAERYDGHRWPNGFLGAFNIEEEREKPGGQDQGAVLGSGSERREWIHILLAFRIA
ncbi:unnamed protein product [Oncorhynchus mykiss]|uniref:Uncharacterized protein n=1 Tax=Oncorhynchus mykiss TaxID=8022 RepID=A0A060WYE7_ONCMY|nr:unnamed protein product [Oncorhynchus mykiss]